jgi:hypothetical protein
MLIDIISGSGLRGKKRIAHLRLKPLHGVFLVETVRAANLGGLLSAARDVVS